MPKTMSFDLNINRFNYKDYIHYYYHYYSVDTKVSNKNNYDT